MPALVAKSFTPLIRLAARVTVFSLGLVGATNTLVAASPAADTGKLDSGEHYAPLGDVRLHYTVAGKGPLLIVCSPGWGINSGYLQGGLVPLEKSHTLLFIDTRGSGLSSRPADRTKMSSADMADDIEHLRQYLELPTIQLLGHSDSGGIAIDYAERFPATLDKLILVDSNALGNGKGRQEERAKQDQKLEDLSKDPRYASAMQALNGPQNTDEEMRRAGKDELPVYFADPEKNLPLFVKTLGRRRRPPHGQGRRIVKRIELMFGIRRSSLGEIRSKTLILVGKQDWICPVLVSEHIHEGIRGSKLVEIDGSGHFVWAEQPTPFFRAVSQFLSQN